MIDFKEIEPIILLLVSSFLIRQTLIYSSQSWAKSYSQTISFFLLPIITFIITKTISGNIALSLGMIGALSIVRFRTPVKNPLELIIFFALITIGISSAVKIKFGIFLTLIIILILFFVKFNGILLRKFNLEYPSLKYSDGNNYNTLEIIADQKINGLENEETLIQMLLDNKNKNFIYKFASTNRNKLNDLLFKIKKYEKNIKSTHSNFIN